MLVGNSGKCDLVPAGAGREAAIIEIAAGARFGERIPLALVIEFTHQ